MSIQSEINRINNNVQTTLNTIAETGVSVGSNSDALPAAAAALANEKANKVHTHQLTDIENYQEAVEDALAIAKESGEFDGATSYVSAEIDANGNLIIYGGEKDEFTFRINDAGHLEVVYT